MKKKPILLSLLIFGVLAAVLTISVVFAKFSTTLDNLPDIDFNVTKPATYTYAVLDNETKALSIRNRPAKIVDGSEIGKTEGTKYLVDKDGTYELGDNGVVYALPVGQGGERIATGTIPGGAIGENDNSAWNTAHNGRGSLEAIVTSVTVDDTVCLQGNLNELFQVWSNLTSVNLTNADFTAVTSTYKMFDTCNAVTSITFAEKVNTGSVTNMSYMFYTLPALTSVNVGGFNTSNVTNMSLMFYGCKALTTLDVSKWDTAKVTNMSSMFIYCSSLTALDVSDFDTTNVTDMGSMFAFCHNLTEINVSNFKTSNVKSMGDMFLQCYKVEALDVSKWDTSKVTNFQRIFESTNLTTIDVSKWNMSSAQNIRMMFYGCDDLTTLDVSNWNTVNVSNMDNLFRNCKKLTVLDVSKWDTSSATIMSNVFNGCSGLTTLDVSKWETSGVTSMEYMFSGCSGLTTLDVSRFDTTSVKSASAMFQSCSNLTVLDVSGFDMPAITGIEQMFAGCSKVTVLDVSGFDTSKVTRMRSLFDGCTALKTIYASDKFVVNEGTDVRWFFRSCNSIYGGNGTTYLGESADYARIDGGTEAPGYFTAHTVATWTPSEDDTTHSGTCSCTEHTPVTVTEQHTYTNGVCVKCKYECPHTVVPNVWISIAGNDDSHGKICTVCSHIIETETHTYGEGVTDDNGVITNTCSVCGHTKTETPSEDTTGGGTETVALEPTCTCETKCEELNADCEVCKTNYTLCKIKDAA